MDFEKFSFVIYFFIISFFSSQLIAQVNNYTPHHTHFYWNDFSTIVYNDGRMDHDIENDKARFEYPKGSGKNSFNYSGVIWGGKIQGEIRVGGSTYRAGLKPGRILNNGIPDNPNSELARVYRVKRSYKSESFDDEIDNGEGTYDEIYAQYEKDWNEWPAEWGAPFEDIDGNGIYNPAVDVPGVTDADITIWFVANDFDNDQTKYLYGSFSMGIELQVTVWGNYHCENAFFKRYKIINKNSGGNDFEEMYLSQWCDPDIGESNNDFVGCDTLLQLGFAYNGTNNDQVYGAETPAVGYTIMQGPMIDGDVDDTGYFNGEEYNGKKNLGMSSFYFFVPGDAVYTEPRLGDEGGAVYFYVRLQGKILIGIPFTGSHPSEPFPLSGDPFLRTGWYDGILHSPGNRMMGLVSGPFKLKQGESQEMIVACVGSGFNSQMRNLDGLSLLEWNTKQLKKTYRYNDYDGPTPMGPAVEVSQFDGEVILTWGNIRFIKKIESQDESGFKFQGYKIYQMPSCSTLKSDGLLIATYDVVDGVDKIIEEYFNYDSNRPERRLAHNGSDSGIERYMKIDWDYFNGRPLINGSRYYYTVTAYNYNKSANIWANNYESPINILTVIPHSTDPGIRYESNFGDKINVTHYCGVSSADVDVMIVDPSQTTGHRYEITFYDTFDGLTWQLDDMTSGEAKLIDQQNITGTDEYCIVDGFRIIITQDSTADLTSNDIFTFTSPGIIEDVELAKYDVDKINVFPNPYYGAQAGEISKHSYFVTINHLPKKATIKVFNLAGHLVRTIEKYDESQFARLHLLNDHGLLMPSGLYIIYIEMPELGKVKILKLAIVQRGVIPDRIGGNGYVYW